jgi:methionine-rich copper-binding protein CopC/putative copper export protein
MRQRQLARQRIHGRHPYSKLILLALSVSLLLFSTSINTVTGRSVALAHAFVIGSDPIDGSTVATVPRIVRIFFASAISPASIAYVFTPDEQMVDAAHSTISGKDSRELDTPLITPDHLPQGSYTVRWTALASSDGHTTHGVIGFNVGRSSTGLSGETILGPGTSNILPELDTIGILAVAWEWLVLMALTFWVGILVIEGLILAGVERTSNLLAETHKRARPLQWLCLAALLVGELITLLLRATQLSQGLNGSGIDLTALDHILFETRYGYLWLLRIALIGIALGLLWWTNRSRSATGDARRTRTAGRRFRQMRQQAQQIQRTTQDLGSGLIKNEIATEENATPISTSARSFTIIWLLLAGLILLTLALAGDVAALSQAPISAIMLNWLYLAARCIWFGATAYLGYVLLPLLAVVEPDHHSEILTLVLRRFHPLMLTMLGMFLVSGIFLTETSLNGILQFTTAPYGRTLLVEWILIAAMVVLSAYALFTLKPKLSRQTMLLPVVNAELPARRTRQTALDHTTRNLKYAFRVQSWLGMAVLLCAALLSFFAPPIVFPTVDYTQPSQPSSSLTTTPTTLNVQIQEVGNLAITLQILPGRIHYANTVIVSLKDRSSGNLVTGAEVKMSINMVVMDMGTSSTTIKGNNPTYIAVFKRDTAFSMPGDWDIGLTILRPGKAPIDAHFTVTVEGS